MLFNQLGLSPEILKAIIEQGYTEPTPIQAKAIPPILAGQDIMGCAQTGTGKTAGFTLPMLQRLQAQANTSTSPAKHPIRALILVPTRELAAQVHENVKIYGKHIALKSVVIYGGVNMNPQIKALHAGVEILVATPGRLLDHVQQKTINLSKVEILVLDEADRMLDMGFLPDIKRILMLIPEHRQSLMFSATFSAEIKKFADGLLKQPVLIEVARSNAVSELVTHVVHPVSKDKKTDLLIYFLELKNLKQVLVFVRTKQGASLLAQQLQRKAITAAAIHGDKNQLQRTQALNDFKQGTVQVLVATDVAARGLDIEDLPHVINFELPNTPEDYVHRIGRTGRAGAKGNAISFVCEDESELLADIEKLLKTKLLVENIAGFEQVNQSKTTSSNTANAERKSNIRGKSEQKKNINTNTKRGRGRDERTSSRSNTRGFGETRQQHKPVDPIFTQPYVPPTCSIDPTLNPASNKVATSSNRRYKKPLPALFMEPVTKDKDAS